MKRRASTFTTRRIAQLTGLRPAVADAPRIVFFHLPKCGGTSVEAAIAAAFRRRWPLWTPEIHRVKAKASTQSARLLAADTASHRQHVLLYLLQSAGPGLISGHFGVSAAALDAKRPGDIYITTLRHPYDQVLSLYYYNRHKSSQSHFGTELGLEAWLDTINGGIFTKFFGGTPENAARHIAALDVVGDLARMPEFCDEMRATTGLDLRLETRRANPVSYPGFEEHPAEIRARIEAFCEGDVALYESIRDLRA